MNTRGKKVGKTATFENEQINNIDNSIESTISNNRNWSSYLYQILQTRDFDLADTLTDCLHKEIGITRTSRILDLALLLLESNHPSIYQQYKNRAGIVVIEE
jgi:hypothetical protein